ncbi:MAG: class I SAM-dependent methyltransferase [Flavobacteriaceae bacterium]|nr:class I SAM-dependent methyltransferase [Flavobacteriaceae bacterium]
MRKNKVQILKSGVENLTIKKNTIDKILSINTIYFWKNPDQIMNELYRILKPKGKLLLAFNSKKEMIKSGYNPEIFTFYELSEVEDLLKDANFMVIESSYEQFKIEDCHCIIAQKNA